MAALLAGGGIDRAGAAQRGEAGLAVQPGRVVPDCDEQGAGDLGGYPLLAQKPRWGGVLDERTEPRVELVDLRRERLMAAGDGGHGCLGCLGRVCQHAGAEPGGDGDPLAGG